MENGFANLSLTTSHQALQGGEKYKVKKLDFETCGECQITACDGGTIKFCAPVHFDPEPWPPHPHFDPCQYGQDIRADHFIAKDNYQLSYTTSTCPDEISPTVALGYFHDLTVPASPVLSTTLQCGGSPAGSTGGGYIVVHSTDSQPVVNPSGQGIQIIGGDLANTNDILIEAGGASAGDIQIRADSVGGQITVNCDDIYNINSANATGLIASETKLELLCRAGEVAITSSANEIVATAHTDFDITSTTADVNVKADQDVNIEAGTKAYVTANDVEISAIQEIDIQAGTKLDLHAQTECDIEAFDMNITLDDDFNLVADDDVNIEATTGSLRANAADDLSLEADRIDIASGNDDVNITATLGLADVNLNAIHRIQIGYGASGGGPVNGNVLRIKKSLRFPPAGTDNAFGRAGDRSGDVCFVGQTIGLSAGGYLYYCVEDFPGPVGTHIWMRVQMSSW